MSRLLSIVCFLSTTAAWALSTGSTGSIGTESVQAGESGLSQGSQVSLNPQPLPPRQFDKPRGMKVVRFGDDVSLNPQPLPPKWGGAINPGRNGDDVKLNPQPLPPKTKKRSTHVKKVK